MKVFPSRKVLKPFIVACTLLATSALVYAAVGKIDANRYQSNPGDSFAVTDAGGAGCQIVSNNSASGKSYFIPTKTTAEWTAFKNTTLSGITLGGCSCTTPWGSSVTNGLTATGALASSVPYGSTCSYQTGTCTNGVFLPSFGSYTNQTCAVTPAANCTTPWGTPVTHGLTETGALASTVPYGSTCSYQTGTCTNGAFSPSFGSYTNQTCAVTPAANCTSPWGTSVTHGSSVTASLASSVPYGSTCSSQTRTCSNGTLSGSYTNQTCVVTLGTYQNKGEDTYTSSGSGGEMSTSNPASDWGNDPCDGNLNVRYTCAPTETRTCTDITDFVDNWEYLTDTWTSTEVSCVAKLY